MIEEKKTFFKGLILMAAFIVVLILLFMPLFGGGQNALDYLDNLYNSISKGSAYYIEDLKSKNRDLPERPLDVTLTAASAAEAEEMAVLFRKADAAPQLNGSQIGISGDLKRILAESLADADTMFRNDAGAIRSKYGIDGRQALFRWWTALKILEKELTKLKRFDDAKLVASVNAKAVECAYNYFGVESQSIGDKVWIVILSLAFYVFYTLWFGYSIMFLFEGWGMDLGH